MVDGDEQAKAFAAASARIFRPTHINPKHLVEAHPIAVAEFEADGSGRVGYLNPAGGLVIVLVPAGFLRNPGSVSEGDMLVRYEPTKAEPAGHLSSSPSAAFDAEYQAFRDPSGEVAAPRLAGLGWREVILAEQRANAYAADKSTAPKLSGLNFGEALEAVKAGACVGRVGWNGKGMWLRLVFPYSDPQFKVTELPGAQGTLLPWIGMKTADNGFVPWLASQTDMLAEDWTLVSFGDASTGGGGPMRFEGAASVRVEQPAAA